MKRIILFLSFFFIVSGIFTQTNPEQASFPNNQQPTNFATSGSSNLKSGTKKRSLRKKLIPATDTLTTSDYMISIERVNDKPGKK